MLSLLHTVEGNVEVFDALLQSMAPDVPVRHRAQPELLAQAMRVGADDPQVIAAVRTAVLEAAEDAEVVLCTCSSIGAIAEATAIENGTPVLRVDRAMAREAVATGPDITVAAAVESTLAPTRALIEDEARRQGRDVRITEHVVDGAWDALQADGEAAYHRHIASWVREMAARRPDVIVLAQASMAGAAPLVADLPVPVLASPPLGTADAIATWRNRV